LTLLAGSAFLATGLVGGLLTIEGSLDQGLAADGLVSSGTYSGDYSFGLGHGYSFGAFSETQATYTRSYKSFTDEAAGMSSGQLLIDPYGSITFPRATLGV
jgi:hypothetical protein